MLYEASDRMTCDLIKAKLNDPMESVFSKMRNNRIRHLPVTDDLGRIIGIISDRDMYRAMLPDARDYQSYKQENVEFSPSAIVRDYMSWPVKTVAHDTDIKKVIRQMVTEKVSALLVTIDEHIVGIVTSEDLLKLLHELLEDKYYKTLDTAEEDLGVIGSLLKASGEQN